MSLPERAEYLVMHSPCCDKPMRCLRFITETQVHPSFWTDPKAVGEMLLTMFSIRRCPHCHTIIWLGNSDVLGKLYSDGPDRLYLSAKYQAAETDRGQKVSKPKAVPTDIRNDPFVLACIELFDEQIGIANHAIAPAEILPEPDPLETEWTQAPTVESIDISGYFDPDKMPTSRVRMTSLKIKAGVLRRVIEDEIRGIPVSRSRRRNSLLTVLAMLDVSDLPQRVIKAEGLRELGRFDEALDLLTGVSAQWGFVANQIADLAKQGSSNVKRAVGRYDGAWEPEGRRYNAWRMGIAERGAL